MEYICDKCNKKYSSYQSLWIHNKKYHTIQQKQINKKISKKQIVIVNDYNCKYCEKEFNYYNNKWRHEKTCKSKKDMEVLLELEKLKLETVKTKLEIQKDKSTTTITFKGVNKMMMNNSNNTTNTNNTQNIVNNNNYNLVSIGKENIVELLTNKEKKQIMDSRFCSLEKLIEITHCGKYNKFKNILVTNLKDDLAYKYDEIKGYFITGTKHELIDDLITSRVFDLEAIYDELSEANKIDDQTKKIIQKFLDQIQSDAPYINEEEDVTYPNYKTYKIKKIKILLYNNCDKITKDIALLIST